MDPANYSVHRPSLVPVDIIENAGNDFLSLFVLWPMLSCDLSSRYVKDELHINTIRSAMKFSQEFQKRRGGTVQSCKVTQIDHQVEIVSPNQNQILRLVHVDFQLPCFCLVFGISSVFVTR